MVASAAFLVLHNVSRLVLGFWDLFRALSISVGLVRRKRLELANDFWSLVRVLGYKCDKSAFFLIFFL
jgi:hypothetical protein